MATESRLERGYRNEKTLEHEETTASAKVGRLVMTGLFMAMTCVATMVLVVPSPSGGYMNLGDAIVLLGAFLLGPVYGGLAGGIGAAIADLLAGYTHTSDFIFAFIRQL